jgi:hypothetical protein
MLMLGQTSLNAHGLLLLPLLLLLQEEQGADSSCSSGLSTRESISTIKRLLREVFADHLAFKSRLDSLEKAAADEAEAADDYELRNATGSTASSWARAPVRVAGWFSAAGVLPWTAVSLRCVSSCRSACFSNWFN